MNLVETFGRRFARVATDAVVRRPSLWWLFRRPLAFQFDRLAPQWHTVIKADHLAPLEAALDAIDSPPRRVLDLGTGTGAAARLLAGRWPEADVTGVDLAERMVEEARRETPAELADRIRFEAGDANHLSFDDGTFDLVTLVNMIPFFDELARVVAPGGSVAFAFSSGADTPIYVPFERIRRELEPRSFSDFADFSTGRGSALLATKRTKS
jgi:SAM-dependent methyltransferase